MNSAFFRPILESGKGGLAGQILRTLLIPTGWVVEAYTRRRRAAAREGRRPAWRAPVPVISVGNLTAGGTGKTPCVAMLIPILQTLGFQPAVVSRGYGAQQGHENDETRLLRQMFPNVIFTAHPKRQHAIERACTQGASCILLDDGFQHVAVARDIDIVLLDATAPFGGGRVLPAGLLREPTSALSDADIVILTRTDLVTKEACAALRHTIHTLAPKAVLCEAMHRPLHLTDGDHTQKDLAELRGLRICAASAIGRPEAFRQTLLNLGGVIVAERVFPDHHTFTPHDLTEIYTHAEGAGAQAIVMTTKDAVKITPLLNDSRTQQMPDESQGATSSIVKQHPPFLTLHIAFSLVEGEALFLASLTTLLKTATPTASAPSTSASTF